MNNTSEINYEQLQLIENKALLLEVDTQGVKLLNWVETHKTEIMDLLLSNGALLIRGLKIMSSKQFGKVLEILFGDTLAEYIYRSTPRTELRGNVYTATEYHPDQHIPQHNENAYTNRWPMKIGFMCTLPAKEGGVTPIADSRSVYKKIPKEIVDKFEKHKVMYVRNYSAIDLPWSEVFQTENKEDVELYCRENNMTWEWLPNNELRTKQINQATAKHPVTGEKIWFNQAHLFHVSSLEADVRENLLNLVGEEKLPRNTYYGDGSPIESEYLQLIRELYEAEKISFQWQKNDLMLLDNMLFTHGRGPFSGPRQILVGMADSFDSSQLID